METLCVASIAGSVWVVVLSHSFERLTSGGNWAEGTWAPSMSFLQLHVNL